MKKGHRRTQSANLATPAQEEAEHNARYQGRKQEHSIMHLLQKCQLNAKQTVCQVEPLNATARGHEDKLFNFGRGLPKTSIQHRNAIEQHQNLRSIPEKFKNSCKTKKHLDSESVLRIRVKPNEKSVLKMSHKEPKQGRADFTEEINKLIKVKLGGGLKSRKLSMYEPMKSAPKQWKHKKEISNLK